MKNNLPVYLLSFLSGFLALGIEIIWIRAASFATSSLPQAFAFTLAMFLMGLAFGALLGRKICAEAKVSTLSIGKIYLLSGVVDLALFYGVISLADTKFNLISIALAVFISAIIRGMVFPIIHHIGSEKHKSGREVSNVYFMNIMGSALAPILIGFVLLDYLTTQQVYLAICALTLLTASFFLPGAVLSISSLSLAIASTAGAVKLPESLMKGMASNSFEENNPPVLLIENKHGVIAQYTSKQDPTRHVVFGNNAYDGDINTNIFIDTNTVSRAFMLGSMSMQTENVLVIGLSSGAWVKALLNNPYIKKLTIVEINPGYIELIKNDSELAKILQDKRVEIIFDDGRKWITKNQDKKFDLVMMNTTFHWRAYASNLLSQEFLTLVKNVMSPAGVVYFNSTWTAEAYTTAKSVFQNTYQHRNMVLASQMPVEIDRELVEYNLCEMKDPLTKEPIFDHSFKCHVASFIATQFPLTPFDKIDPRTNEVLDQEIITDDNMRTEYKRNRFDLIPY